MITLTRRSLAALLAAASMTLTAPLALAELAPVKVALEWTPNTNQIGLYVAQAKGFFAEEGLAVTLLPYTDSAPGTLVSNGIAEFGVGNIGLYSQRAGGADIKGIYAVVQQETGRLVVYDAREDITSPKDLDGKIYGGFGSAWEKALIASIIKHDGGKGEFRTVTLGTAAYEALANRAVDFTLEIVTWQGVKAELVGEKLRSYKYTDYGVPQQYTTVLISSDAYIAAEPEKVRAFVAAVTKGYAFAADNPQEAADIILAANPETLTDRPLVEASLKLLSEGNFLRAPDGTIGSFDPARFAAVGQFMVDHGILIGEDGKPLTTAPDFGAYFTNDFQPSN